MGRRRLPWMFARALLFPSVVLSVSCVDPGERSRCEEHPTPIGNIDSGETTDEITATHQLRGSLQTDLFVERVLVGGVPAKSTGDNFSAWTVDLSLVDLDANRDGDHANIDVLVFDICDADAQPKGHVVDTTSLLLRRPPAEKVTGLNLDVPPAKDQCYLPSDGSAPALVRVTADAASVGATVHVTTSQGTLGGADAPVDLVLKEGPTGAYAETFFTSKTPGTALLQVSAPGSDPKTDSVLVASKPSVFPENAASAEDTPLTVTVRTLGDMATCQVDASYPDQVEVLVVDPDLGVIDGTLALALDPVPGCGTWEVLRLVVKFAKGAPKGSAVTLRCFDTWGQEGTGEYALEEPPDGGTGP